MLWVGATSNPPWTRLYMHRINHKYDGLEKEREPTIVKAFASSLVQSVEKHVKVVLNLACYKIFRWSCLLVRWSPNLTIAKNSFTRVASM